MRRRHTGQLSIFGAEDEAALLPPPPPPPPLPSPAPPPIEHPPAIAPKERVPAPWEPRIPPGGAEWISCPDPSEAIARWADARGDGRNPLIRRTERMLPVPPSRARGVGPIARCHLHLYPDSIEARRPGVPGRELVWRAPAVPAAKAAAARAMEEAFRALEAYFRREVGEFAQRDRDELERIKKIGRKGELFPEGAIGIRSFGVAMRQVDFRRNTIDVFHAGDWTEIWRRPGWNPTEIPAPSTRAEVAGA